MRAQDVFFAYISGTIREFKTDNIAEYQEAVTPIHESPLKQKFFVHILGTIRDTKFGENKEYNILNSLDKNGDFYRVSWNTRLPNKKKGVTPIPEQPFWKKWWN